MGGFREPSLSERQAASAKARKAALDKFRAQARPGEPAFVQQQAERVSRAAERTAAKNARAAEKAEKLARETAERERATREAAEKAAREAEEKKARAAALEAEQKAARDKRYAARKARQK
jgi:hypothetical protein